MREIQVVIDDFRVEVIKAILFAYPDRAFDNDDPSDDMFLIDGVPVKVEGDRIVVGDDIDNYIPLKDAPVAGQPPRYRDIDSILIDFKAYIDQEKIMTIEDSVRIPGTNIILEKGDRIICREATEVFKKSFLKHPGDTWYTKDKYWEVYWDKDDPSTLWIYHTDEYGEDYYESEDLNYADVSQIVFNGTASYSVKESTNKEDYRMTESLSSGEVNDAQKYWRSICKKYSASAFERMINQ